MTILRMAVLLILAATLRAQEVIQPIDAPLKDLRAILIDVDSGALDLKESDVPRLRGEVRYSLPSGARQQDYAALIAVEGSTLVVHGTRIGGPGLSKRVTLNIPKGVAVSVIGLALSVRADGRESPLNIRTISGSIEIVDPIGSTVVSSDTGNIIVTIRAQPRGDLSFHTDSGFVKCTLDEGVSLKTILRSGARIAWSTGVDTFQGSVERNLGAGGPLMYADSRTGEISVSLTPSVLPVSAMAEPVFRVNADWVYMNVVVRNQAEQAIPNLKRESFNVLDNGIRVDIRHFESTNEPFRVLLLFDVSGSIKPHANVIREAARQFIRRTHDGDEFAVAVFSSTARLVQPFTADRELAEKALSALTPGGGTAIYDAVQTSVLDYMKGTTGRKAVVVFTDGVDNSLWGGSFGSTHSFKDLMAVVKTNDCIIYPIFVVPVPQRQSQISSPYDSKPNSIAELLGQVTRDKSPKPNCVREDNPQDRPFPCPVDPYQVIAAGENNLRQLADQTGGRFYTLRKLEDLASTYDQIAADLTTVYTLGFLAKDTENNEWHDLTVSIRDYPLAIVRTRGGYSSSNKKE